MKNYIDLVKFQLRKKSNILSILAIGIAISAVFIISVYMASQNSYIKNEMQDEIYYRTMLVSKEDNKDLEKIKEELEEIKYINNISYVPEFQYGLQTDDFKTTSLSGDIWVFNATNDTLPEIVEGTNFPDDDNYYLICPVNFYPTNNINEIEKYSSSEKFNIRSYLNKKINFTYYGDKYYTTKSDNYTFTIQSKLIGLYKNSDYSVDENICYANKKFMTTIAINNYKDEVADGGISNYEFQKSQGFIVEIDKADHVNYVKNELKSKDFYFEFLGVVDREGVNKFNIEMNIICILIITAVFLFNFLILEKDYTENEEYYNFLKILGYNKNERRKVYILSNIVKNVFCIIVGIIASVIICAIAYLVLNYYPFLLRKYRLVFDFKYFIIITFILLFVSIINILIDINKVGDYE